MKSELIWKIFDKVENASHIYCDLQNNLVYKDESLNINIDSLYKKNNNSIEETAKEISGIIKDKIEQEEKYWENIRRKRKKQITETQD